MVLWCYGVMVLWCYGVVVLWCYGVVVLWCCGVVVLWYYGVMVLWCYSVVVVWYYGTLFNLHNIHITKPKSNLGFVNAVKYVTFQANVCIRKRICRRKFAYFDFHCGVKTIFYNLI